MDTDRLLVSTHRRWVADELRAGAPRGLEVVHDLGFDVPGGDLARTAWWTPGGHAARLAHAGVPLRLAAPSADLLSVLPPELTGREVLTGTLSELSAGLEERGWRSGWAKVADAKVEALESAWYDDLAGFLRAARDLPPGVVLQVSPTRLEVTTEFRVTMVGTSAVAVSPYVHLGQLWEEGMSAPGAADAAALAEEAATGLDEAPSSMVLDIALTPSGPVVLEANPVWCAAFYGADTSAVVEALVVASAQSNPLWVPDAFNASRAARQRPLGSRA
jgi:hypothetical protein